MNYKLNIIIAVSLVFIANPGNAQDWIVPEDIAKIENPSTYNLDNVKKGKEVYLKNCKSCHGDPGKNNQLPLVPLPPDVTSQQMQSNTDGSLFHKITKGRATMPQFETTVSEDDRWRVINFIRNYSPDFQALLLDLPPIKAKLLASVNEETSIVEILAEYENKKAEYVNLSDAPVSISAKKAFGNIEIGQVFTNENGRAEFKIPESLIGDEEGYVNIVVSLNEDYEAGDVSLEKAKVGNLKKVPKLITKEVLWSTNDNISLWLLISYIVAAGFSWLAIGWVILQIVKIKKLSKE